MKRENYINFQYFFKNKIQSEKKSTKKEKCHGSFTIHILNMRHIPQKSSTLQIFTTTCEKRRPNKNMFESLTHKPSQGRL